MGVRYCLQPYLNSYRLQWPRDNRKTHRLAATSHSNNKKNHFKKKMKIWIRSTIFLPLAPPKLSFFVCHPFLSHFQRTSNAPDTAATIHNRPEKVWNKKKKKCPESATQTPNLRCHVFAASPSPKLDVPSFPPHKEQRQRHHKLPTRSTCAGQVSAPFSAAARGRCRVRAARAHSRPPRSLLRLLLLPLHRHPSHLRLHQHRRRVRRFGVSA